MPAPLRTLPSVCQGRKKVETSHYLQRLRRKAFVLGRMGKSETTVKQQQATSSEKGLSIGQLEASYPAYCKALKMLIRDDMPLAKIQRTVCWDRLHLLHRILPRQYRDPLVHYGMLKRAVDAEAACAA